MKVLTKEDVYKMLDEIKDLLPEKQEANPFLYSGIPIIENPYIPDLVPVIKLSEKVTVSNELREKCNKFYIDMFGYQSPTIFKAQYGFMIGPAFKNAIMTGVTA